LFKWAYRRVQPVTKTEFMELIKDKKAGEIVGDGSLVNQKDISYADAWEVISERFGMSVLSCFFCREDKDAVVLNARLIEQVGILNDLRAYSVNHRNVHVLDVGCGKSDYIKHVTEGYGFNYVGIDVVQYQDWVKLIVDGKFPSLRETYDVIICHNVLQHIDTDTARSYVKQIRQLCHEDTYVCFSVPTNGNATNWYGIKLDTFISVEELVRYLKEEGFCPLVYSSRHRDGFAVIRVMLNRKDNVNSNP
jgi:SAM-dependent methyltransferase